MSEIPSAKVSLIVAMTRDRVIGKNNQLPWKLPRDLKYFKETTGSKPIIMGRKTFDSIGRPLPGRKNIVLSRTPKDLKAPLVGVNSLDKALIEARSTSTSEIFIIGGASLFNEGLKIANRLYITWIDEPFDGDVRFPEFDLSKFEEVSRYSFQSPFPHHYSIYDRG